MALLDEAGFTSVVATNCDQHYERPLVSGDHPPGHVGHRCGLRREADRARGRPLHHHPARVPGPEGRAGRHDAVPDPQVQAAATAAAPTTRPRWRTRRPPRAQRPPAETAPARAHPGQPLLLRRGRSGTAADPALHHLRHAAPPTPPGVCALPLLRVGHARPRRAGAPSTASWSTTTHRCRPSTIRWSSPWSSSRRAPASWPTCPASPPTRRPSACRSWPTSRTSTTS